MPRRSCIEPTAACEALSLSTAQPACGPTRNGAAACAEIAGLLKERQGRRITDNPLAEHHDDVMSTVPEEPTFAGDTPNCALPAACCVLTVPLRRGRGWRRPRGVRPWGRCPDVLAGRGDMRALRCR